MATTNNKKKPERDLSSGTISLIETPSGDLRLVVDIDHADGTTEAVLDRIKRTLCGLQYLLNKSEDEVVKLGEAYIEGLETGIHSMQSKKSPKDETQPMGFHARVE